MKVLVGSENPVKIEATERAFGNYFDTMVEGIKVGSEVSEQPINDETFEGAYNRAIALRDINNQEMLGAEYFVGIEGGIIEAQGNWYGCGVVCIMDREGNTGFGTSGHFPIPPSITERLLAGEELGPVTDVITGEHDTKSNGGAVGYFTQGVITRADLYIPGIVFALTPFLHKDLFAKEEEL